MMTIETIIDVPTCELTLSQVLAKVNSYQATYPERKPFYICMTMRYIVGLRRNRNG